MGITDSDWLSLCRIWARTILAPRSRCAPLGSFRGEDAYTPDANISGDIRRVVERVHVPEPHSRSTCDGISQEGSGTSHDAPLVSWYPDM